ncbi:hypothetical protein BDD12DRAFT_882059 [Trichophaea hybrida]|nr:hypothetical protein BDD12DRAFT_882059 [Trichophaea hybrida]
MHAKAEIDEISSSVDNIAISTSTGRQWISTPDSFVADYSEQLCGEILTTRTLRSIITEAHEMAHPSLLPKLATKHIIQQVCLKYESSCTTVRNEVQNLRNEVQNLRNEVQNKQNEVQHVRSEVELLRELHASLSSAFQGALNDKEEAYREKQHNQERNEHLMDELRTFLHGCILMDGNTHNLLDGSVDRKSLWQLAYKNQIPARLPLDDYAALTRTEKRNISQFKAAMVHKDDRFKIDEEQEMYGPVQDILHSFLQSRGVDVMATYNRHYLNPYAPDISFSLPGLAGHALGECMFAVMELKYCKDEDLGKDANLGQLYDYLLKLRKHQPNRSYFFGVLSNIRENIVISVEMAERLAIRKYHSVSWDDITRFLIHNIESHKPRELPFLSSISGIGRILGVSRRSCVAVFKRNGIEMAVKAAHESHQANIQRELAILRKLGCHGHENIPQLVYSGLKDKEFGITPVGEAFGMHRFATAERLRGALEGIINGLAFLHHHGIVHRDIRRDNIITKHHSAIIIDFDHAIELSALTPGEQVLYEGGYICTPHEVLLAPDPHSTKYTPKRSHDLNAFVMLLIDLLFPMKVKSFRSYRVLEANSKEHGGLLRFWNEMDGSAMWGPFVKAAKSEDYDTLKTLLGLVVWPSTCNVGGSYTSSADASSGSA